MKLRHMLSGAVAALLAMPAAAALPTKVYVFGDSFTDSGNANLGTGGIAANASQGYFQGRFGDGYNFADFISKRLTGEYATPFLAGGDNFSVGGARAAGNSASMGFPLPGLNAQLGYYAAKYSPTYVDPDGLYIINFGNNDVNAIQNNDLYGLTLPQYQAAYVSNMVNAVLALNAGGAKRVILLGVPNPDEVEGQVLQSLLDTALDQVEPFLTTDLTRFDFFAFFNSLRDSPTRYSLPADVDFTTPCLAARPVVNGSVDCTGYFSFDGIHVTEPVQFEIARAVLTQAGLPTVPEPGTWALMIVGFGMTGLAVRRRAAQPA